MDGWQFLSAAGSVVTVCPVVVVVWAFISKENYRAEAARVVTAVQALLKPRTGRIPPELPSPLVWKVQRSLYIAEEGKCLKWRNGDEKGATFFFIRVLVKDLWIASWNVGWEYEKVTVGFGLKGRMGVDKWLWEPRAGGRRNLEKCYRILGFRDWIHWKES